MEHPFIQDTTVDHLIAHSNTGYIRVSFKVHGYWSRDSISVYGNRKFYDGNTWEFSISHASGGRDTKEVESDADAVMNFAAALREAARVVRALELHVPELEAAYQRGIEELRVEEERKQAERAAKIEADPAIGHELAQQITADMVAKVKSRGWGYTTFSAPARGTDSFLHELEFKVKMGETRTTFYVNGNCVKREAFTDKLAGMSARNMNHEVEA